MKTIGLFLVLILSAKSAIGQIHVSPHSEDMTVISGTVGGVCTVETLTPNAVINLADHAPQQVTDVVYTCNSPNGFTRTISSGNNGFLKRGDAAIAYTIAGTGDEQLGFSSRSLNVAYVNSVPSFSALTQGATGKLSVRIGAVPDKLVAGQYGDTVTIEITPN